MHGEGSNISDSMVGKSANVIEDFPIQLVTPALFLNWIVLNLFNIGLFYFENILVMYILL